MTLNTEPSPMNRRLASIVLMMLLPLVVVKAQLNDFQSWHEVEIQKELSKKMSLSLGQEIRLAENSSYVEEYVTTLGVGYKFNKYLRAKLCYRYTHGFDFETGIESAQRLYGDLTGRYKIDRFTFSLRERYQVSFANYTDAVLASTPVHYLRTKLVASYNINKSDFNPYASVELFHSLNNPMGNGTDKYRLAAGFDYEFTKHFSAGLYYQLQVQRISYRTPSDDYIVGTSFAYSF